jgi:hypothetical protein
MSLPENDKLSVDSGNLVKLLVDIASSLTYLTLTIDGHLVDFRRRVAMTASVFFRGRGCVVERDA